MEAIVKYEPPDYVVVLRAETQDEAQILMWFLQPDSKAYLKAVNWPGKDFPDIEIRKEPAV